MSDFYYASFVTPRLYKIGTINDEPIYANCARCGKKDVLVAGAILDSEEHRPAIIPTGNGLYTYALYCQSCFEAKLEEVSNHA